MQRVQAKIRAIYSNHPALSNVCMYSVVYGAADISRQTILQEPHYDWANTLRMTTVGAAFQGPFFYYWYRFLDHRYPSVTMKIVFKKTVISHFFTASVGTYTFYAGMSLLEGKKDIFEEAKVKFFRTFLLSSIFWPPVALCGFRFVPSHLRTTYIGFMYFVWVNILSYLKAMDITDFIHERVTHHWKRVQQNFR